jgi:hypothetical protein
MSKYAVNGKEPIAAWIPSLDTAGNGTTTLTDLVASNSGTLTNMDAATDWVADTGAGGVRALDFDGLNDYVVANGASSWFSATMSCSFWVKGSPQQDRRLVTLGSSLSPNPIYSLGTGLSVQSKLRLFIRNNANVTLTLAESASTILDGNWHHVAFSDNNGTCSVFIDGALDATSFDYTPSGAFTLNRFSIAALLRSAPATFFAGRMDDVRIWNQSIILADAQYLYASGSGRGITKSGGIIPILRQHYAAQGAR